MRITSSMYYNNLFGSNNSKLNKELFDVNKQIASGLKIQYASDDVSAFAETMRLDNELTTIGQSKKSSTSGYKVSDQSDVILNEFTDSMNRMKTLLIQAANGTQDTQSLNSIAAELRGVEKNLRSLSNSSINGEYLFSGSAVDVKPIAQDGTYQGNDLARKAFSGSQEHQQYNITGADLFLGEELTIGRKVVSNVHQSSNVGASLSTNSSLNDFMGAIPAGDKHFFYIRGSQSDGTAFSEKIQLDGTSTVNDLLSQIGSVFGNSGSLDVVTVSMTDSGNIEIKDKIKGSSKIDFHMVGASDFAGGGLSNVTDINDLASNGTTNYATALTNANKLYIREFNKSDFALASGTIGGMDGIVYDRTMFNVVGNKITSNVSQIDKNTNAFATPSTKLIDVASGTSLDAKQLTLSGTDVNGVALTIQIDLHSTANGGSTFSPDGGANNYKIYDTGTPRAAVDADTMTYQQLMDVVNMSLTSNVPATTNSTSDYDTAVNSANDNGRIFLSHDGKINFNDLRFITTKASMSLHDSNAGDFTAGKASVLTFNTNNALTIADPKTDFFREIDNIIKSVEEYKLYSDASSGNKRTIGIEDSISKMDDLQDHIFKMQSIAGSQSNILTTSINRLSLLEVSTASLRSSVIDTDLAEAALSLNQLTLNYQAMLSTVSKVSQLSLVNYL